MIVLGLILGNKSVVTPVQATETPTRIETETRISLTSEAEIEDQIYSVSSGIKELPLRKKTLLEIGGNELTVLNHSNVDINLAVVTKIYDYVERVNDKFEQNNWIYQGVNFSYGGEHKIMDIQVRSAGSSRTGLVFLPNKIEIPGLNLPNVPAASTHTPVEITFLRVPWKDPVLSNNLHNHTDNVTLVNMAVVEACQTSAYVSSPQDTIPRSFIASEIYCNSLGWWVTLRQDGYNLEEARELIGRVQSDALGIMFNPIPPDQRLYSEIPIFGDLVLP